MDTPQLGTNEYPVFTTFNVKKGQCVPFLDIFYYIHKNGQHTVNRKGQGLYEMRNVTLVLDPEASTYCLGRYPSQEYLEKELDFYASGSRQLEDAVKMSKFWSKCSDDGKTINSNYGFLLFHDENKHGFTQFEHAINCLRNNPDSKKAVMTLYSKEHAYISNDNPCTLIINLYIQGDALNMQVIMRSNDLWYGLPYDLPFFRVVHYTALAMLKRTYPNLELGYHIHQALNLHFYEWAFDKFRDCEKRYDNERLNVAQPLVSCPQAAIQRLTIGAFVQRFIGLFDWRNHTMNMNVAWTASKESRCLKKKCGAVIISRGEVIATGYGDRDGEACTECARDKKEVFYSDGCYSVHAEMRACIKALQNGFSDWSNAVVYVTHGPCDACLKLLNHLGVRKVIYDKPYKTDYKGHWPLIEVLSLTEACSK
jgi:deoxycytidylate deaminase/thymidylate synthase